MTYRRSHRKRTHSQRLTKKHPDPATAILHADKEGLERQESLNYPSIIRQLNYLAQNS
jgi:hypothetical protein